MSTCVGVLQLTRYRFHTIVFTHTWVVSVLNVATPGNGGAIGSDFVDACNRSVSDGIGIGEADGDGVDGNDCCDVDDRSVSDGVGFSKADGDGVVYGGAEDEDGVACEVDVDGAGAKWWRYRQRLLRCGRPVRERWRRYQ